MSKIAVIQLDTETLRGVYGIEELLVQPSVVRARSITAHSSPCSQSKAFGQATRLTSRR
jgi:hypothetical protein